MDSSEMCEWCAVDAGSYLVTLLLICTTSESPTEVPGEGGGRPQPVAPNATSTFGLLLGMGSKVIF